MFKVGGSVILDVLSPCPQTVHWMVFTASYRKIMDKVENVSGGSQIRWDLKDDLGRDVSNGVYFLRFEGYGGEKFKIAVLR
jgi:hypothetical protein